MSHGSASVAFFSDALQRCSVSRLPGSDRRASLNIIIDFIIIYLTSLIGNLRMLFWRFRVHNILMGISGDLIAKFECLVYIPKGVQHARSNPREARFIIEKLQPEAARVSSLFLCAAAPFK